MKVSRSLMAVLRRVAADLVSLDLSFALVGGLAVTVRGEPRFTRDIDFAVLVKNDLDAEQALGALLRLGYRVTSLLEQTRADRLATARLTPPGDDRDTVVIDLLFSSSGIEPEIVRAATREEVLPGLILPVATRSHLVAMKLLSAHPRKRLRDFEDIDSLIALMSAAEIKKVEKLIHAIKARGFNRKLDLQSRLKKVLKQLVPK